MTATARTAPSAGRLRAETEIFPLLSYQKEKSGQCQPWVYLMEMTAVGNLPAGPQTLQGEATNPIAAQGNGALPPSLSFVTRSTPMPALLSQDGWDVAPQWGTLCCDTRVAHLSFLLGRAG